MCRRYGECCNTLSILFTSIKFLTKKEYDIAFFFAFSCRNRILFVVIISALNLENAFHGFC